MENQEQKTAEPATRAGFTLIEIIIAIAICIIIVLGWNPFCRSPWM